MPTIIIEDGSGIASGANSYVTVLELRAFASDRGVTLDPDDNVVGTYLIQASDWIQAKESEFIGTRTHENQPLAWPRTASANCDCDSVVLDPLGIPAAVKQSQSFLAIAVSKGLTLLPDVTASDLVIKEKIDVLETTYAEPSAIYDGPYVSAVVGILKPYMVNGSKCGKFSVYRG